MKAIAILFTIIFVFIFAIGSIISSVHAESDEPQVGLKLGQWTKYRPLIESGGFGVMEKFVEPLEQKLKEQFQKETGLNIDNVIWIKYTVADISGSIVTFDRSAKLATNSETRDEFRYQSFLELLDPENKIDDEVLAGVYEKKLESKQFDLTKFEPGESFAMPTNLEFGSKFAGSPVYGEITFASIEDIFRTGTKENLFTANKINTQTFRNGVVETTIETDALYDVYYDRQSGLLNSRSTYLDFTNMNTYDTGWITIEIAKVDRSDNLKSTSDLKPINDKDDILERLSYLFVESAANSRYLFTNMIESIGESKKTTFDIINTRDGSELGALILHGDDIISSVRSSTVFTGLQEMNNADDIHIMIRQALVPGCCYPLPTHSTLLMDNIDEGNAQAEATFDDVKISLGWVETDPTFRIGIFAQEIIFLDEDIVDQNNTPKQIQEEKQERETMTTEMQQKSSNGGGCLIATATFGSELAPQVQQLREIRDNSLLQTESGRSFMESFNQFYYSFSPVIADYERENPVFKEAVKLTITPLLTSLSLLNYVDMDSEVEVLGYGISLIIMNVGMYFVLPAIVIHKVRKFV